MFVGLLVVFTAFQLLLGYFKSRSVFFVTHYHLQVFMRNLLFIISNLGEGLNLFVDCKMVDVMEDVQESRREIKYVNKLSPLSTLVESDPKALFSIATTLRCRGERYSIIWIAPLYP